MNDSREAEVVAVKTVKSIHFFQQSITMPFSKSFLMSQQNYIKKSFSTKHLTFLAIQLTYKIRILNKFEITFFKINFTFSPNQTEKQVIIGI